MPFIISNSFFVSPAAVAVSFVGVGGGTESGAEAGASWGFGVGSARVGLFLGTASSSALISVSILVSTAGAGSSGGCDDILKVPEELQTCRGWQFKSGLAHIDGWLGVRDSNVQ